MASANTTQPAPPTALTPAAMAALERLRLRHRTPVHSRQQGSRRSRLKGQSLEYAGYRAYAPGDDPRALDWNAFARFESLLIKQYDAEVALPLAMLIDGSASMTWGDGVPKFKAAQRATAALSIVALESDTPAGIANAGHDGPAITRRNALGNYLSRLGTLDPARLERPAAALAKLAQHGAGHTVALVTDGYDIADLSRAMAQAAAAGVQGAMLHVLTAFERAPDLPDDTTLSDAESNEELRVAADEGALDAYRARLGAFLVKWEKECRRVGWGYALMPAEADTLEVAVKILPASGLVTATGQ